MAEEKDDWKEDIIQNKLGGKREWSDQERMELCHQLDKDLQDYSKSSGKKELEDRWTEDNWREKMGEHPLFSPYLQSDKKEVEAPINELSDGLALLKYDKEHNSPEEVAKNYKEEGLFYFKHKKYQKAISSFTEAIKARCSNNDLVAQLYNNRAASHFYLENYKASLTDSCNAIELKPGYVKAFNRALECASKLRDWDKMINLCNEALVLEPSSEQYKQKLATATTEKKKIEVEKRKNAAAERKIKHLEKKLLSEISNRGIKILPPTDADVENEEPPSIVHLQPQLQSFGNKVVHLNCENELIWPVLFLYPEYETTDSILEFNENSRFVDHFEQMFGDDIPPAPWDIESKYKPENLCVYYFISSKRRLSYVSPLSTLKEFSLSKKLEVKDGILSFIILVEGSKFQNDYLKDYVLENE